MSAANPLREAAMRAAERGWHVFPLRPNAKTPVLEGDWSGHATTDPDQIRHWWNDNPRRNIAIATGLSGLLVIDIDIRRADPASAVPTAQQLWARLAVITGDPSTMHTFAVRTPSGGAHFYYRAPTVPELGCSVGRIGPLIDSRGRGGYVVATGSRTRAGTYRLIETHPIAELPSALVELLAPPPPRTQPSADPSPGYPSAYLAAIVTDEARRVADAAPHTRNATLFRAALVLGRLFAAGELTEQRVRTELTAAAVKHVGIDGFTHNELDRAITNGLIYGAHRPRHLIPDP
ncbi:bifunctional DNA primase/polymerase [Nocardia sp. NPDC050175]|uniref:bifunctional DNA primase/polymerase n=1 Tax=Nocardia sp. NPDC050175 TaxID=3364317 RepID=UPI00378A5072